MKRYLWCEDSASGYQFWSALCRALWPDIIVESKRNNTRLIKAAGQIRNDGNIYYILIDDALDNQNVAREIRKLNQETAGKHNVNILKIHSFEFALLSFELLERWVFSEKDELKEKRKNLLDKKDLFIRLNEKGGTAEELAAFTDNEMLNTYNSEQIAAKLLFEITRNTGFETDKGHLGECFIIDCCEWESREQNDICGLDNEHDRLNAIQKAEQLVKYSILNKVFERLVV